MATAEARSSRFTFFRSRWMRRLAVVLVLLSALVGIAFVYHHFSGDRQLKEALAEADRLDPGWRLHELEAKRRPMPPEGKNGIDQIEAVNAAMPAGTWPQRTKEWVALEPMLSRQGKEATLLNDAQMRQLEAELAKVGRPLGAALNLVEFSYGRAPIDLNVPAEKIVFFDHIRKTMPMASMLRYDATLRANQKDSSGALLNLRAILAACASIGDEPSHLSQIIRFSLASMVATAWEKVAGLGEFTEADLRVLQEKFLEEWKTPHLLLAWRALRAGNDLMAEQDSPTSMRASLGPSLDMIGRAKKEWFILNRVQLRAQYLKMMTEAVEIAKLPPDKQTSALQAFEEKCKSSWWPAGQQAEDNVNRARTALNTTARLAAAVTTIAAERFRMANHRWPKNIEELIPKYLGEIPIDPWNGQPMRMKQVDGGLVVYSVGKDQTDGGGEIGSSEDVRATDVGLRLFDPAKRRQPPKASTEKAKGEKPRG